MFTCSRGDQLNSKSSVKRFNSEECKHSSCRDDVAEVKHFVLRALMTICKMGHDRGYKDTSKIWNHAQQANLVLREVVVDVEEQG